MTGPPRRISALLKDKVRGGPGRQETAVLLTSARWPCRWISSSWCLASRDHHETTRATVRASRSEPPPLTSSKTGRRVTTRERRPWGRTGQSRGILG
eukprot:750636-Hanusia_phi.AAC.11